MIIRISLTDREQQLVTLFHKKKSLSTANGFEGWGGSPEFKTLRDHDIIFHCNYEHSGEYIRYSLTALGELAYKQIEDRPDKLRTKFNSIIEAVENRCMATDGPITPTLQEMRESELAELWKILQRLKF